MSITITDIVGILIIYQSIAFLGSILFIKITKPVFLKVLIAICLLIILHFSYLFYEKYSITPYIMLGPFFGFLYGPIYYLYTKSLIVKSLSIKKVFIQFVPAIISFFCLIFFRREIKGFVDIATILVILHFITYLLIALRIIYRYRRLLKNTTSSFYNISLRWMEYIIYLQFITIVVVFFHSKFHSAFVTNSLIFVIYLLVLILINCFYYLGLKQVRLFKGFAEEDERKVEQNEYQIPDEIFNSYINKLSRYMEEEKPYLEFDLSLQDLSNRLSISKRNLSHIINKKYNRNFFDYINNFRIEMVKQDILSTEKSIKEIMYNCGYSNKTTFHSIFKKYTGLTPNQFRSMGKK
ncbi:MAG: hypothetical protein A2W99_10525 [Bacteroidetes bacterium GWF2_33_16]|nr:MAG: hypothetical protein A2X00_05215 [Bacteroidetes bacterium GWE2_32_14]OFY03977.1 MAG: hypothetical protein A2W99_10525 [Bacteroidetes bacterium GWF2_33_16]